MAVSGPEFAVVAKVYDHLEVPGPSAISGVNFYC